MKKKLIYLASFCLFFLLSCSNNQDEVIVDSASVSTEKSKLDLKSLIDKYNNSQTNRNASDDVEYDYENAVLVQNPDTDIYAINVTELNPDENDFNTRVYLLDSNDEVYSSMTLNTKRHSEDNIKVEFYNERFEKALTMDYNPLDGSVLTEGTTAELGKVSCGQKVSDCVSDAYQEEGWYSVGLAIASLAVPEIFVAAVLVCVKIHCK